MEQSVATVVHDIPGRLRLIIPALNEKKDFDQIKQMFSSIKGIHDVRIEPIIQSMVISYNHEKIGKNIIVRFVNLFFKHSKLNTLDYIMFNFKPKLRKDFFRSILTGFILLLAYLNKTSGKVPGILDYAAVISTAYTVLSHGENKLGHPDVITGIVSMLSIGSSNILHVALVTWGVNVIELLNDASKSKMLA
ncbi:HMA2 domain-containing protein [Bacillus sp. B15-48]|uniref:HMA2 domain-containing protein n=1 Tax=Bacillus sp. B15-48 TaxID=1548601 RepID=UPI00193F13D3|nr:hypothetical protein [Bacillus sp. B15-48]MBM4764527.1 hypothetical protein [Bacillus sp. B15-48]